MVEEERIRIGSIGRPHGIRGELRIHVDRRYRDQITRLDSLLVGESGSDSTPSHVEGVRPHQDVYLVKLEGVSDRDAADELRGLSVTCPASALIAAGGVGPFPEQLIGFDVVTEEGAMIGSLEDVVECPAGEMYVVREGEKEHLIPAVPEMILEIDLANRRITARPVPGLLDLAE